MLPTYGTKYSQLTEFENIKKQSYEHYEIIICTLFKIHINKFS